LAWRAVCRGSGIVVLGRRENIASSARTGAVAVEALMVVQVADGAIGLPPDSEVTWNDELETSP